MEKLERVLEGFVDEEGAPHGFDERVDEVAGLFQSRPLFVVVYDDVVVGDIMLFMLSVGLDCCCAGANDELPMPGLLGAIAGKEALMVPNVLSGVIARLCAFGGANVGLLGGGGETGGVDHANVAAGEALLLDLERLAEGKMVDDDVDVEAFAQGSPSMFVPPEGPCCSPRTSASKSASSPRLAASKPFVTPGPPPKLMNSLRVVAVALLAPSSCSLRVCSFSMRADMDLISVM
jgi:hypothetical protein